MDKKLHETTNLCVEIMNSTRQRGKLVTQYVFAVAIRHKHDAKCLYRGSFLWNIKMYEKTNPFLGTSFLFLWKNPNDPVFLI